MRILVIFFLSTLYFNQNLYLYSNIKITQEHLLVKLLKKKLEIFHYSHKKIDDNLSKDAYKKFIEKMDYDKKFFLTEDIKKFEAYKVLIDDEIRTGEMILYKKASIILRQRIKEVDKIVTNLLKKPFNFSKKESFQSDAKKRSYSKNKTELLKLWKNLVKFSVLSKYITTLEEQEEAKKKLKEKKEQQTKKSKEKTKQNAEAKSAKTDAKKKAKNEKITPLSPKEIEKKARTEVKKSFERLFKRMLKETDKDYLDRYINAVTVVFDPHTTYLPPDRKEDFDIEMRGSLEGIGALLREDGPYIKVVRIIPGSASWRQKQLQAEDIILKVAQGSGEPVDIVDMRVRDAVKLIRGPKGAEVRLTVKKPDGRIIVIPIVRDVVQIEEVYAKGTILKSDTNNPKDKKAKKPTFGYIHLPKFYRDFERIRKGKKGRNCTEDVAKELKRFVKNDVKGVILDLRYNGGGALEDARQMSGLFIKEGPIVQVKRSDGVIDVLRDTDPNIIYSGPLVVLINKFSASASEILAAALQDYRRAIIIGGEHSHGKGTVQVLLNLDRGIPDQLQHLLPLGALKVTIQKFYRIDGKSTQYKGVTPDIILPDPNGYLETGEQYQDYSLPWDEVKALPHKDWKKFSYPMKNLIKLSKNRVKKSKAFQRITESVKILKKRRENTMQSLNLKQVLRDQKIAKREAKRLESLTNNKRIFDTPDPDPTPEVHSKKSKKPEVKKNDSSTTNKNTQENKENESDANLKWIEKLYKDPYIVESISTLNSILHLNKSKK